MVGKVLVSAFQNFLRIENPLNIKEVMEHNVWQTLSVNALHVFSMEKRKCPSEGHGQVTSNIFPVEDYPIRVDPCCSVVGNCMQNY